MKDASKAGARAQICGMERNLEDKDFYFLQQAETFGLSDKTTGL